MKKAKPQKSPLTSRAALARINRALKDQLVVVKKSRPGRAQSELGAYYTVSLRYNLVTEKDVDLKALAEKLECLRPWEEIVEDN